MPKPKNRSTDPDVVFSEITVDLRKGGEALTVDDAKKLIGWTTEAEESERQGEPVRFQTFHLRDLQKNKVRLLNNLTNRPLRLNLARRYANEILRGKWRLNGETIVVDKYGNVQDGQHRLVGLILAEQMRQADPKRWAAYGVNGPVTMGAIIIAGIEPENETVDTLNLGQKRTLGDVLFRNHTFGDLTDREQRRLANMLSVATRLVWLRAGGQDVSDAPHFPHSEALDFIERHPRLIDAVRLIYDLDGGERSISSYVSAGYAAGLFYLMAASETDPEAYLEKGEINLDNWAKAHEFWTEFAAGSPDLNPLRTKLTRIDAGGSSGRDELIAVIIKAMQAWLDNAKIDAKALKVKKSRDDKGRLVLAERPRLGGLDVDTLPRRESKEAPKPEPKPKAKGKAKKGKKSKKGWQPGDLCWVKDDDGEIWYGTVREVYTIDEEAGGGRVALVQDEKTGDEYEVPLDTLSVEKPK